MFIVASRGSDKEEGEERDGEDADKTLDEGGHAVTAESGRGVHVGELRDDPEVTVIEV